MAIAAAARVDRLALGVATLLLVSGIAHLVLLVMTGGSWQGPLSFRKPATFGLSFGITLLTIVWVRDSCHAQPRERGRCCLSSFTAASLLETVLVSLQAWRGVPSHFNVETAFDAWVTRGLAGGGIAPGRHDRRVDVRGLPIAITCGSPSLRLAVQSGTSSRSAARWRSARS